jgi:hypothetical protein
MIFRLIDAVFGLGISKKRLTEKLGSYAVLRDNPTNVAVLNEFSSLDSKSNSLLQHVSIMIASLSVSYTINPPEGVKTLLLLNIFCYLIVILMTLRVIVTVDFSSEPDSELKLLRELKLRERYYMVAHSTASLLTTLLVVSILFAVIYYRQHHNLR